MGAERIGALIERLENASGPDREIDAEIAIAFGHEYRSRRSRSGVNRGREWLVDSHGGVDTWTQHPPAYTSSVDAALALFKRAAPDCVVTLEQRFSAPHWRVEVYRSRRGILPPALAKQDDVTPALALCLALLRALSQKESSNA